MTIDVVAALDALQSHAASSGWFEAVNGAEPKSAPSVQGLTYAIWLQGVRPIPRASGLAVTSALVTFQARVYTSMISATPDVVDPTVAAATVAMIDAYTGDFELGGAATVDLLGIHGEPLAGLAGYLNQDGKLFRVVTINIPVIYNDAWTQVG